MIPQSVSVPVSPAVTILPDLSDAEVRAKLSPAASHGMVRIAEAWRLSTTQASALACVAERTWARMKKGEHVAPLSQDELTRASLMTGIFKALRIVFAPDLADAWPTLPNNGSLYRGQRPIDVMTRDGIPGMMNVRRHVDALRGGL